MSVLTTQYTALDHVQIVHSTRFPTLCTLTVGAQVEDSPVSAHSPVGNQDQWLLLFTDPRDNSSRRLRLHTLDIYFWTTEDADQFLDAVQRLLPAQQVETDRNPQPQPQAEGQGVSAVVKQLENVAITDPSYQNGQTRNSRSQPSPTATKETTTQESQNYAPLAYNPAAPAAPEPIKHREKTPPPADAEEGTGLSTAAAIDQGLYHPQAQVPAQVPGGFSHPQAHAVSGLPTYGYSSPPPSAGFPPAYSMPASPGFGSGGPPPLASPPPVQAAGMSFAPPPQNPNAHLFAQGQDTQQARVPQHYAHSSHSSLQGNYLQNQHQGHGIVEDERVAIGGYSNYSYSQPVQQHPSAMNSEYDIHSQVYRPTEHEAKSSAQKHAKKAMANPNSRPHKLEEKAGKVENKVNGFLKRLEKTIG